MSKVIRENVELKKVVTLYIVAKKRPADGTWNFKIDTTINNHPNIKSVVEQAMCDWNANTKIDWRIDTVSNKNTKNPADTMNLIYFADSTEFTGKNKDLIAYTTFEGRWDKCGFNPGNKSVLRCTPIFDRI